MTATTRRVVCARRVVAHATTLGKEPSALPTAATT
jgi:hypothetical protein